MGRTRGLLLVAVLLVALNLRGAIAAVSPVLPQIRAELSLSASQAGLLTALPVLCFAALAPASAGLGRRAGLERAVLLGLAAIAVGTVARALGGVPALLAGTVLVGAGMTVGNVLVPVVAKRDFGARAASVTGLYTAALCAGAAATAAATAPLAGLGGWRFALASWALLAAVAAALWQVSAHRTRGRGDTAAAPALRATAGTSVWRHPTAWAVALLLGAQSVAYYVMTAWLPTLLVDDAALDLRTAGLALSVFQILGVAGTLLVPVLAARRAEQSRLGLSLGAGWALTVTGFLVWPAGWLLWCVVGGVVQGAGISLAFTVLVLRAGDAAVARDLSAMSQLVGYTLAALGPLAAGALYEATGGWTAPMLVLLAVCAAMGVAGVVAGRDVSIGARAGTVSRRSPG